MAAHPRTAAHLRPGELSDREGALRAAFLREVERIPGGEHLRRCIQCGTCSGSCPVSHVMDVQPRQLVAYFRAGDLESILRSRTLWLCASCYSCTVRCPSGIRITDLIYGLKRMAMEGKHPRAGAPARHLSRVFTSMVRRHGRNQELELSLRYYLGRDPRGLVSALPLAWSLFRHGRLPWRVSRIRARSDLRRIIDRAKRLEPMWPREAIHPLAEIGYGAVTEVREPASGGAS
jgi:quinone-modifying oxidoreductase subunit QmoC